MNNIIEEVAYIYGLFDPITYRIRYVGQTINPDRRFASHISEAKTGYNVSYKNNWIKGLLKQNLKPKMIILRTIKNNYCANGITHYLEDHSFRLAVDGAEMYFIEQYKFSKLTNLSNGGRGLSGEHRKRIVDRMLNDNPAFKKQKTILQYNLNGDFIKEWNSAAQAGRELKLNSSNILNCAKNKCTRVKNYMWKFKEEIALNKIEPCSKIKNLKQEIVQKDLMGNTVKVWKSMREASKEGFECGNISKACSGKIPNYKGYIWEKLTIKNL